MNQFCLIFAICVLLAESRKLPSFVNKCKKSSKSFPQCFLQNIENIRPYLGEGIPELSIPPMKPLIIPRAQVRSTVLENIEISNADKFQIQKLSVSDNFDTVRADVFVKEIGIKAKYQIKERILLLQLQGNGSFTANVSSIHAHAVYKLETYERKGKQYFSPKIEVGDLNYKVSDIYFENLFPERQDITDSTNQFINENIEMIIQEFKPSFDQTALAIFQGMVGRIFQKYPVNELLYEA